MVAELQMTNREDFLIAMTLYLIKGGDMPIHERHPLSETEVRDILNDSFKFFNIDVIKEELSYFSLIEEDFTWE